MFSKNSGCTFSKSGCICSDSLFFPMARSKHGLLFLVLLSARNLSDPGKRSDHIVNIETHILDPSHPQPTNMAAKRLLEVESKFAFKPSLVATLQSNGGLPAFRQLETLGTNNITDTYFDTQDVLSRNGIWLRQRMDNKSTILEAKIRVSGDFTRSTFEETTDQNLIRDLVRQHVPQYSEEKANLGLDVLAKFVTMWQAFRADDKFAIMLDHTDFGHSVGEVELMAEDEDAAHREIDRFMARYPWFFEEGSIEGKLAAYFRIRGCGTSA